MSIRLSILLENKCFSALHQLKLILNLHQFFYYYMVMELLLELPIMLRRIGMSSLQLIISATKEKDPGGWVKMEMA